MKKALFSGLLMCMLAGCGDDSENSSGQNTATAPENAQMNDVKAENNEHVEIIDDETQKLIDALQASPDNPDCKIPATDYQYVSCFYTGEKTIFLAESYDEESGPTARALIDINGQKIADLLSYDVVDNFIGHGLIAVSKDGKIGYINKKGELVIPLEYESTQDMESKYDESWANVAGKYGIVVKRDDKFGIINHNNETILPFDYDSLEAFDESGTGLYSRLANDQLVEWGILDYKGNEIKLPIEQWPIGNFAGYDGFSEGLLGVCDGNGNCGFVNKQGELVIPMEYGEIRSFSEGLAGVMKDGLWGFIDKDNKVVIDFQYPDSTVPRYSVNFMGAFLFEFNDNVAEVSSDVQDETICIDKSQNIVPCE